MNTESSRFDEVDRPVERLLYSVTEAMTLLNLSRASLYEELRSGRLHSVLRGRRRLFTRDQLNQYVELVIKEGGNRGAAA